MDEKAPKVDFMAALVESQRKSAQAAHSQASEREWVLGVRFRSRHRAESGRAKATAQLIDTVLTTGQEWVFAGPSQIDVTILDVGLSAVPEVLAWRSVELAKQLLLGSERLVFGRLSLGHELVRRLGRRRRNRRLALPG